jgi:hypothetical protein
MSIPASLLPEFDQETANTARMLALIPDEHFEWRPHAKSFPMGHLGNHTANLVGWVPILLQQSSLDLHPPGGQPLREEPLATRAEVLSAFATKLEQARPLLANNRSSSGFWVRLAVNAFQILQRHLCVLLSCRQTRMA